jgi:hypothetical protein
MTRTSKTRTIGAGLLLLGLAAPAGAQQQQTPLALVKALLLQQRAVVRPVSGPERTAVLGDRLHDRDVIATTPDTRAAIAFTDDGSVVRLNPSSQLTVTATGERSNMIKTLTMDVGEIYARVARNERERSFQIQTPSGVAAVKGTTFIVRVASDGTATVTTLDGVVEFFNGAGSADVGEGQTVVVGTPNSAPQPRSTTAADLASVQGLIDDDAGAVSADRVQVEIQVQDGEGRTRTIVMELPRAQARAILGGGR